jgi:hypothetical protein
MAANQTRPVVDNLQLSASRLTPAHFARAPVFRR